MYSATWPRTILFFILINVYTDKLPDRKRANVHKGDIDYGVNGHISICDIKTLNKYDSDSIINHINDYSFILMFANSTMLPICVYQFIIYMNKFFGINFSYDFYEILKCKPYIYFISGTQMVMIESQTVPKLMEDSWTLYHIKPINTGTQMVMIELQTVPKIMEDSRTHHNKPIYIIKFQLEVLIAFMIFSLACLSKRCQIE